MKKVLYSTIAASLLVALPIAAQAMTATPHKQKFTDSTFSAPQPIPESDKHSLPSGWENTPNPHKQKYTEASTFTAPRPISELKGQNTAVAVKNTPSSVVIQPNFYTSLNWHYPDLLPGTYIDTFQNYTLSGDQDVPIKFVQYPSSDSDDGSKVLMGYQLVAQDSLYKTTELYVNGSYTSIACSITFPSVPKGTYKLRILNHSPFKMDGNGYVFWW